MEKLNRILFSLQNARLKVEKFSLEPEIQANERPREATSGLFCIKFAITSFLIKIF